MPPPARPALASIAAYYRGAALLLLNTLIVFIVLNAVLYLPLRPAAPIEITLTGPGYDELMRTALAKRAFGQIERFYPGLTAAEVAQLVFETYARPFVYEPFTQFAERPFKSRFVNVSPSGFRFIKDQGPWPPEAGALNVFVFGGSTTFGAALPDEQTVPSHLQDILAAAAPHARVRVYNFGRGWYISTQERALFERLLMAGTVPTVAVFIDGLNDFYLGGGDPWMTGYLRDFVEGRAGKCPAPAGALMEKLPVTQAARWVGERVRQPAPAAPPASSPAPSTPAASPAADRAVLRRVITHYLDNKRIVEAVARAFGVRVLFVWQPVPTYKYDLRYHAFAGTSFGRNEDSRAGYEEMAKVAERDGVGADFLWCADIQATLTEPLYVDQVHYKPRMARMVARCVAKGLVERGLVDRRPPASRRG